ncbi:MAG: (d)CMP kinase [Balneolaceae bacterium]
MIIVIDGLSGSGKSSTAKAVSESLDIQYLDSGALYRAATWIWLEENKPDHKFLEILTSKDIQFEYKNRHFNIYVDSVDVSADIRKQRIFDYVSNVAAMPVVRKFVNHLMRNAVKNREFIADGRDLGSAVFPDADLKFFMEASLEVRARRRYDEFKSGGETISFEDVKNNLRERDAADQSRDLDPLVKPADALVIDTTNKTFDEQVKEINTVIQDKLHL